MLPVVFRDTLHLGRGLHSNIHDPIDVGEIRGVHFNNPPSGDRGEGRASLFVKSAFAGECVDYAVFNCWDQKRYVNVGWRCGERRR